MIHLTATGLLWVNMKRSTHQLRRMIEKFFFIPCYCQMSISFRCFFYFLLSWGLFHWDSISFSLLFVGFFKLAHEQKKNERCVESLTKRKTFLIIHQPAMEIPGKNTVGLSTKRATFTSCTKRKTVISPPMFPLFHFFFLSRKDHTKTFTMSQKSKFIQNFSSEGIR